MKKIYFFALMAIVFATTAQAQKTTTKNLTWGYKIGINCSNLRVEDGANTDWKTGLATGLFFNVKLTNKLSLQPEALYSSMGAKNVVNGSGSLRLNYFSLPVMIKYPVCKNLSVLAGPQIDMLIQAKTKSSSNQFDKVTNDYNESSFGFTGGAEWWPVHCFGFSARYIYGLNDVAGFDRVEMKNQGVQLMSAVKF